MKNFSEKILDKIKSDNIQPKPKYLFFLKNILLWIAFFLSTFLGAVSVSLIYFFIKTGDVDIYKDLYGSFFLAISYVAPFFWIFFLIVFLFLSYLNFRLTDKGYRYKYFYVFIVNVILSFVLGSVIFYSGISKWVDNELSSFFPIYRNISSRHDNIWMRPEKGFLIGTILEKKSEDEYLFRDYAEKTWRIDLEEARIPKRIIIMPNLSVKIRGEILSVDRFKVIEIRPLERFNRRGMKNFERNFNKVAY